MEPSDPVAPVAPVAPASPAGPAGPWTGTVTTATGVTAGLSHALKASAIIAAVNTIEYFMGIPFNCLTKTAVLKLFSAIPNGELPVASADQAIAITRSRSHSARPHCSGRTSWRRGAIVDEATRTARAHQFAIAHSAGRLRDFDPARPSAVQG